MWWKKLLFILAGWTIYSADKRNYEKIEYDIVTKEMQRHNNCWPNGGKFFSLLDTDIEVQGVGVVCIKRSKGFSYDLLSKRK